MCGSGNRSFFAKERKMAVFRNYDHKIFAHYTLDEKENVLGIVQRITNDAVAAHNHYPNRWTCVLQSRFVHCNYIGGLRKSAISTAADLNITLFASESIPNHKDTFLLSTIV